MTLLNKGLLMTSSIRQIFWMIEEDCVDESIQELVKDMKATQHGDRVNPFYELVKDYHKEGGVWKHTMIALRALPEIASVLGPEFEEVYADNINDLRAAILYHDIGKVATQTPSTSRVGSYSFPQHSAEDVVDKVAVEYGIALSPIVRKLVVHHHDSPEQFKQLPAEFQKLLAILKVADNMAVGPKDVSAAVAHVKPFLS
jgi:23S rRNA maturation-related 3'-5' exoribonuclease YhaM